MCFRFLSLWIWVQALKKEEPTLDRKYDRKVSDFLTLIVALLPPPSVLVYDPDDRGNIQGPSQTHMTLLCSSHPDCSTVMVVRRSIFFSFDPPPSWSGRWASPWCTAETRDSGQLRWLWMTYGVGRILNFYNTILQSQY